MSQTWEEKLVKTEKLQHERQQALEKMGISVQASGIQVEKSKYYLVNLNADPSLNELLVYYLKVRPETQLNIFFVANDPTLLLPGENAGRWQIRGDTPRHPAPRSGNTTGTLRHNDRGVRPPHDASERRSMLHKRQSGDGPNASSSRGQNSLGESSLLQS